jgi:hypothetical protein
MVIKVKKKGPPAREGRKIGKKVDHSFGQIEMPVKEPEMSPTGVSVG